MLSGFGHGVELGPPESRPGPEVSSSDGKPPQPQTPDAAQ